MKIKKADIVLLILIVVIGAVFLFVRYTKEQKNANSVEISVEGKLFGVYDLDKNQEILIGDGTNKLLIKDGVADMIWADCPDKLCVHQKPVSANNETIICLPNQVVVTVVSENDVEIDGYAK